MKQLVFAISLAIALAGCAKFSLVEPTRTVIGDLYSVDPQIQWSSNKSGKYEVWTVDGPGLQRVQFINGIDDNEALYKGKKEYEKLVFKKSMTASEIMDLFVDGFTADNARKIETKNFKPHPFGSHSGFRFDLSFVNKEGLEWDGLVVGAVINGKLYLISYAGARAYYFPKYKAEVERIIQSIKMQG
jgi:hypothetical protein